MKTIAVYTDGEVIGDGVIKLRFIDALKRAFPSSHLTWIVGGKTVYQTVLAPMVAGRIDAFLPVPAMKISLKDVFAPAPDNLRGRHFDVVIDTQKNAKRTLWLRRNIGHGIFISSSLRFWLSDKRPKTRQSSTQIFDQLMVLGQLVAGQPLQATPIQLDTDVWQQAARRVLPQGHKYIGFVPGAGQDFKRWPFERYMDLAGLMQSRGYMPVFILGPMEHEFESRIRDIMPDAIIPHRQATGIDVADPRFTMAVGQLLDLAVANDSGGGHLIAAGDVPMVSLFRSASVRDKFLPATSRCIGLSPDMFGGHHVTDIPFEGVVDALNNLQA